MERSSQVGHNMWDIQYVVVIMSIVQFENVGPPVGCSSMCARHMLNIYNHLYISHL